MTDMDLNPQSPHPDTIARGYELDVSSLRFLSLAIGALMALAVTAMLVVWGVITLIRQGVGLQTAVEAPPLEGVREIRAPLDPNQPEDLRELSEWESQALTSYRWIDREAGVVAIPVERAIQYVSENGLPGWSTSQQSEIGSQSR